jgi:integrase/recombinase XerD
LAEGELHRLTLAESDLKCSEVRKSSGEAMKAYLDPKDVESIEETATCLRDRLLIRILFHLGCRISEALALRVDDVDFDRGSVIIEHLKSRLKLSCPRCSARLSKMHRFCPGCGESVVEVLSHEQEHRRMRTLPLDGETLRMLKDYICRGGPVTRKGKRLIFGISRHRAWQVVCDCAHKAGLGKLVNPETGRLHNVSPHRLRDAFAVFAVKQNDSGDGLRLLQEHLGHASFDTTARYRKVAGEEHREWYEKLWNRQSFDKGDR